MLTMFIPDEYYDDIYEIDPKTLAGRGIKGVICDIDNTLVPYEEPEPTARVKAWLDRLKDAGIEVAFVSNNGSDRVERFNRELGYFAAPDSGKPSRRQLRAAMNAMGTNAANTVMLGDQIFTDVYAGKRLGLYCILVKPIKDKKTLLFRLKRLLERPIIALYKMKNRKTRKR